MKSIKSIKETKDVALGTIKRVDDKTAINMVGNMWAYISKAEWKAATRKSKPTEVKGEENSQQPQEQTDKKPYKKGQKSDKHKNKQ
jgi:hypothetical protein